MRQEFFDATGRLRWQPLENVATIASDETAVDTDMSDVFVSAPPLGETSPPGGGVGGETAPPTDVQVPGSGSQSGSGLPLILADLSGLVAFALFAVR